MTIPRIAALWVATGALLTLTPTSGQWANSSISPIFGATAVMAQEKLPWEQPRYGREIPPTSSRPYAYRTPGNTSPRTRTSDPYNPNTRTPPARPRPQHTPSRAAPPAYRPAPEPRTYRPRRQTTAPYNHRYRTPHRSPPYRQEYRTRPPRYQHRDSRTYSHNEILNAGHHFFGSVSSGLAKTIAHLFQSAGRPNGYILGEDAGGAFIAGLRYGEGTLYTKTSGKRRIYWQGPTVGYDFGGEGSRTMVLVYNMRRSSDIYRRFGGVQGSAYVVGGVGVQLLKHGDVTLAPIRSGIGLRLGANVGYLKYTRRPTWNPF